MKATGIVRRIDDLGRIVIPKEIRRIYGFADSCPIEIFTKDDGIVLKRYKTDDEIMISVNALSEAVDGSVDDLDYEKVREIRKHIREIREILKTEERND